MSTLEELKKQAEQARQQAQASASSAQQTWARLEPVMQRLDAHFKELAETLNFLGKELTVDFKINTEITLANLKARNFQIIHPRPENHYQELIFQFENRGGGGGGGGGGGVSNAFRFQRPWGTSWRIR